MKRSSRIFVIGAASVDMLQLPSGVVHTIGGAGMYTALAAARAGAEATLYAPRPQPMPQAFAIADARLHWIGPHCTAAEMPRLAIAHHGNGKATLLDAAWGAEAALSIDRLPDNLDSFDAVHIAALSSAQRMRAFVQACRERRARFLSAGTYFRLVQQAPDIVHDIIASCDAFFMNDNEARGLFGAVDAAQAAPGKRMFITCGAEGARVLSDDGIEHVSAPPADELDPTGAGDTFCGTALTALMRGESTRVAASAGCVAASRMIEAAGPTHLLND